MLPIPVNSRFECYFYDYGNKIAVFMNYKNIIRHCVGTEHFVTHKSQLLNKKLADECKEKLLKWFWRRLGAA